MKNQRKNDQFLQIVDVLSWPKTIVASVSETPHPSLIFTTPDLMDSTVKPPANPSTNQSKSTFWQALSFAWDFGIVVVVPLAVFGIGGRLLDHRLGTEPWIFLSGVIVSIVVSVFLLVFRLKKILAKISGSNPPGKRSV